MELKSCLTGQTLSVARHNEPVRQRRNEAAFISKAADETCSFRFQYPIPRPAFIPAVPGIAIPNRNAEQGMQAGPKRTGHYLPGDVLERTLVLASESKRKSGKPILKLRPPTMDWMNHEPVAFFHLLEDVLQFIAFQLESKSANA